MPRVWTQTIADHRRAVRDATLDTTAALVVQHGLASVTMTQVAKETGIGRATLYKYFPDVESILLAWHERQIASHLERLATVAEQEGDPVARLKAVLLDYATINAHHHHGQLATLLHRGEHVTQAEDQLHGFITELVADGARTGALRDDVSPAELATYCLHALTAAADVGSDAGIERLVTVTLTGLRRTV